MEPEAILIDLDGVLHVGGKTVPGAVDAISYLRDNGYSFRIVSNSTRRSREALSHLLGSMGFDIPVSHIFTPSMAAASYIAGKGETRASILTTPEVSAEMNRDGIQHSDECVRFVVVGDAGDLFEDVLERAQAQLVADLIMNKASFVVHAHLFIGVSKVDDDPHWEKFF